MTNKEFKKLTDEDVGYREDCSLCRESEQRVGQKTGYGSIVYKIGNLKNGWFATLSPKTGGNPRLDFTLQLMPLMHLTNFSQIDSYPELSENFGIIFSKVSRAMSQIMMEDEALMAVSDGKNQAVSIATYGKCTTWKEKKEHLHIKLFPFRNNIGQPYTVDSSFGKKEIFRDKDGNEFVKMAPVKKVAIDEKRFNYLAKKLTEILN